MNYGFIESQDVTVVGLYGREEEEGCADTDVHVEDS